MENLQAIRDEIDNLEIKSKEAVNVSEAILKKIEELEALLDEFSNLDLIDVEHVLKVVSHNSEQ